MIRIARREFTIPLWLWVTVPLAFMLYAFVDLGPLARPSPIQLQEPDSRFLSFFRQIAIASVAGFLSIDLLRRSRLPWYGAPLVVFTSIAGMMFVVSSISSSFDAVMRFAVGVAITAAAGRGGSASLGLALWGGMVMAAVLMAVAAALLVTLTSRLVAGLPLWTRDGRRDFWVTLAGAVLWISAAVGGYLAIRSGYGIAKGYRASAVPRWLPLASAIVAGLAVTSFHLYLVYRGQWREAVIPGRLRLWLVIGLCVASFMYRPDLLGMNVYLAYYDHVRPALRAIHLLPNPALVVGGYRIDVPFHDFRTMRASPLPDGSAAFISVPLPADYGLTSAKYRVSVHVYRRDITQSQTSRYWLDRRDALDAMQARQPGEDAVVQFPGANGGALVLRMTQISAVDFQIAGISPDTEWAMAEQVLRRFVRERVSVYQQQ